MGFTNTYHPEKKEQKQKPGPGNYSPEHGQVKNQEPSYKIGTSQRRDMAFEKAQTFQTSPGQYDPKPEVTKIRLAGWRIGTENRPSMVKKGQDSIPGAGSYTIPSRVADGPKIHIH